MGVYLGEPMNMLSPAIGLLLLLAACTGGSAAARIDYGNAMKYLQGVGVAQDEAKGMQLLKKASDARNPEAELMLGFFKMKGEGGEAVDEKAGMKLFLDAARQGNRDAQYNAGLAYVRAQGVDEDYGEALKWFTAAARQGDPGAQFNLGVMYLNGEGTVKDALTAFGWFSIAEENGYEGANEAKESARHAMTSDEAKVADATIGQLKKSIVLPAGSAGIQLETLSNQPL